MYQWLYKMVYKMVSKLFILKNEQYPTLASDIYIKHNSFTTQAQPDIDLFTIPLESFFDQIYDYVLHTVHMCNKLTTNTKTFKNYS